MTPEPEKPVPPFPITPVPPELLAWATQTLDMNEVLKEWQQLKTEGGYQLEDFITELESRAGVS